MSLAIGGSLVAVVLAVLIVFCLTKRYERRRLRRLSRTTRIDVGDSDDEDEEEGKSTSPTPDVIEECTLWLSLLNTHEKWVHPIGSISSLSPCTISFGLVRGKDGNLRSDGGGENGLWVRNRLAILR